MHPEFAPVAFIAAFSLVLPLPWHWQVGNVATLSIIAWLFVSNLIFAIDAIIWAGNVQIVAVVWCDITTKIIVGSNFALPSACLCICIHLERVSSVRITNISFADKRRRQYFEGIMCLVLPLIFMALHYIVQGHRFDIIEDYGCRASVYFSIPSIFIFYLPPILMAIGSLIFALCALRHFVKRRLSFATHLNASNSALTTSRYLRLMAMSVVQMFWSLVVTIYILWFTSIAVPIRPWTTWSDVHSNFSRIDQYVTLFTPALILNTYEVLWWLVPASTLLFVAFFSFGKDAMDEYKKFFSWCKRHILRTPDVFNESNKSFKILNFSKKKPSHISRPTLVSSFENTSISMLSMLNTPPSPSSVYKSGSVTEGSEYRVESQTTFSPLPVVYKEPKAIGSVCDLFSDERPPFPSKPKFSTASMLPDWRSLGSPRPFSAFTYPQSHNFVCDTYMRK